MKEGDRNTRFFHKMANAHRRINHFSRIKINGEWLEESFGMKEQVVRAFRNGCSLQGSGSLAPLTFPFGDLK